MSIFTQELIGTMMLILLGNGVVANVVLNQTKGNNSGWIVITIGWAMAVFIAASAIGGHLNPAVTIGLAIAGKCDWANVGAYISGQILGAMLGAGLVWLQYRDHYNVTEDAGGKLATFSTAPAISNVLNNLISEIIGTFVLVIAALRLAEPNVGLGAVNALPIALVVLGIGLCLGGTTGYAINPARDLGPRIMHAILPIERKGSSNWSYAWIPIVGPIIGAVLAASINNML